MDLIIYIESISRITDVQTIKLSINTITDWNLVVFIYFSQTKKTYQNKDEGWIEWKKKKKIGGDNWEEKEKT